MKLSALTTAMTAILGCIAISAHGVAVAQTSSSGVEKAAMDPRVLPGDDFYRYANGAWLQRTIIPSDAMEVGVFSQLSAKVFQREHEILEKESRSPSSKLGAFYASYMDSNIIESKGISPIQSSLDDIEHATDERELMRQMAILQQRGVDGLIDIEVDIDDGRPTNYAVMLRQTRLSLPSSDYYRSQDAHLAAIRSAYLDYLVRLLVLAGQSDARERAQAVLTLDADIAAVELDRGSAFDAATTYHPMTVRALAEDAPGIDWTDYLGALRFGAAQTVVVRHPVPIAGIVKRWSQAPLAVKKDWLLLQTLDFYASYLSSPFDNAQFQFYGKALVGSSQPTPRWRRAVSVVSWRMKDALGRAYVTRYFPPSSKVAAEKLAYSILDAYRTRITQNTWMASSTKAQALQKLAQIKPLVGYPDHWEDDGALVIRRNDLVGNIDRAEQLEYERDVAKLGQTVDRGAWMLSPTVTVGWSNPTARIVAFPAAILQPPLFDPQRDVALNYGAIGVLMAHEFTHQFDNNGRRFDAEGKLRDWWTTQDAARYDAETQKLVRQYDHYEPLQGTHANGKLTLSENIADLGGLVISHDAYLQSLRGQPAPIIDGFSGSQRFFLSYAQMLREVMRPDAERRQLLSNEHSLSELRVDTVRNVTVWYRAFQVAPTEKLYLAPSDRVTVW